MRIRILGPLVTLLVGLLLSTAPFAKNAPSGGSPSAAASTATAAAASTPTSAAASGAPAAEEPSGSPSATASAVATTAAPSATSEPAWEDFELDGTHPFVGLTIGPGASGWWPYAEKRVEVKPAFFFGLRGGVTFDQAELGFELAPVTWVPFFDQSPSLSFLVTIGGYPKLGEGVYWPLRFGLGLSALNTPDPADKALMQGRVDLIGLAFQYGHLLFEIDLPSTRFHSEFQHYGIWGWLCNVSVSYFII